MLKLSETFSLQTNQAKFGPKYESIQATVQLFSNSNVIIETKQETGRSGDHPVKSGTSWFTVFYIGGTVGIDPSHRRCHFLRGEKPLRPSSQGIAGSVGCSGL